MAILKVITCPPLAIALPVLTSGCCVMSSNSSWDSYGMMVAPTVLRCSVASTFRYASAKKVRIASAAFGSFRYVSFA